MVAMIYSSAQCTNGSACATKFDFIFNLIVKKSDFQFERTSKSGHSRIGVGIATGNLLQVHAADGVHAPAIATGCKPAALTCRALACRMFCDCASRSDEAMSAVTSAPVSLPRQMASHLDEPQKSAGTAALAPDLQQPSQYHQ